jgi:hypothetical protein
MSVIACNLPNGFQVDHAGVRVILKGARSPGAVCGFGMTTVPDEWADGYFGTEDAPGPGRSMQLFKVGGLFIAKDGKAAAPMAKERARERNGFERLDPDKPAPGIEPTEETKKELRKVAETADVDV